MSQSAPNSRRPITRKARLACVLSGCVLVAISIWAIQHGKLGYISERYRQPVFVSEIGAVGIVLIATGLVPTRLMRKLTALRKYRPFKLRSRASGQTAGSLTKPAKPK